MELALKMLKKQFLHTNYSCRLLLSNLIHPLSRPNDQEILDSVCEILISSLIATYTIVSFCHILLLNDPKYKLRINLQ